MTYYMIVSCCDDNDNNKNYYDKYYYDNCCQPVMAYNNKPLLFTCDNVYKYFRISKNNYATHIVTVNNLDAKNIHNIGQLQYTESSAFNSFFEKKQISSLLVNDDMIIKWLGYDINYIRYISNPNSLSIELLSQIINMIGKYNNDLLVDFMKKLVFNDELVILAATYNSDVLDNVLIININKEFIEKLHNKCKYDIAKYLPINKDIIDIYDDIKNPSCFMQKLLVQYKNTYQSFLLLLHKHNVIVPNNNYYQINLRKQELMSKINPIIESLLNNIKSTLICSCDIDACKIINNYRKEILNIVNNVLRLYKYMNDDDTVILDHVNTLLKLFGDASKNNETQHMIRKYSNNTINNYYYMCELIEESKKYKFKISVNMTIFTMFPSRLVMDVLTKNTLDFSERNELNSNYIHILAQCRNYDIIDMIIDLNDDINNLTAINNDNKTVKDYINQNIKLSDTQKSALIEKIDRLISV